MNLNGQWAFTFDPGRSAWTREENSTCRATLVMKSVVSSQF